MRQGTRAGAPPGRAPLRRPAGWRPTAAACSAARAATRAELETVLRYGVGTTEYMRSTGGYALTLECGQHLDPQAPEVAYRAIMNTLAHLKLIDAPAPAPIPFDDMEALRWSSCTTSWTPATASPAPGPASTRCRKASRSACARTARRSLAEFAGRILFPDTNAGPNQEWYYLTRRIPQLPRSKDQRWLVRRVTGVRAHRKILCENQKSRFIPILIMRTSGDLKPFLTAAAQLRAWLLRPWLAVPLALSLSLASAAATARPTSNGAQTGKLNVIIYAQESVAPKFVPGRGQAAPGALSGHHACGRSGRAAGCTSAALNGPVRWPLSKMRWAGAAPGAACALVDSPVRRTVAVRINVPLYETRYRLAAAAGDSAAVRSLDELARSKHVVNTARGSGYIDDTQGSAAWSSTTARATPSSTCARPCTATAATPISTR